GAGVTVNLTTNVNTGGDAQNDNISGVENLIGSGLADKLTGDDKSNSIQGGIGNDTLDAGTSGVDTLLGGDGDDWLHLHGDLTATDRVDGGVGSDTLVLDGNYAAGLTFNTTNAANLESIIVTVGNDYKLTLNGLTNTGGLLVDGSGLGAGDTLNLNGA